LFHYAIGGHGNSGWAYLLLSGAEVVAAPGLAGKAEALFLTVNVSRPIPS
jgi:hypothetical protein